MQPFPSVSVVMPAYRCENTICQAMDSVLCQQVPLELLVIDDNGDDSLAPIRERYREDDRVRFLQNPKNLGAAESRNRGVALARAPYIAFLDADDIWMPGKLARQLEILGRTGSVLCCTGRELMTPEGTPTGRIIGVKEEITYRELLKHNSIGCSSVVIRTEAARRFPMEHPDSHEDYITWLKVLREYGSARGINEPLLRYRLSTTGKSGNKLKSAKMTFAAYRYAGFGIGKSILCFCSYALHGVWKYWKA